MNPAYALYFRRLLSAVLVVVLLSSPGFAQDGGMVGSTSEETVDYVYEKPTMDKLSQLYWGVGLTDITNDTHIDNYLLINECDMYRDFFSNEFEWKSIRESARAYLKSNKKSLPLRFEFVQPVKLGNYDIDTKRFEILDEFQVDGIMRFEMYSSEFSVEICGASNKIEGYPRGVVIELSRPFTLKYLSIEPEVARAYIEEKLKIYKSLGESQQTKQNLYETRDAYMFMKVKFFASDGEKQLEAGSTVASLLGVLEGIDIYATRDKELPIFSRSFRKRKSAPGSGGGANSDHSTSNVGDQSDPLPQDAPAAVDAEEEFEP